MAKQRHSVRIVKTIAKAGMVLAASCALAVGVSVGFATAGNSPESAQTFGVGTSVSSTDSHVFTPYASDATSVSEGTVLTSAAVRDIHDGVKKVEDKKAAERKAAKERARREEKARIEAAKKAKAEQEARVNADAAAAALKTLPDVNWDCGKEKFISTWTKRIDAYLAGTALDGQGKTFATAAWENGVDPRWSPAISNTESTNGAVCFKPHNAWGWGQTGWDNWEDAINAHVAGLAAGYGYSITYAAAQTYCPPNYDEWFKNTLAQMKQI